MVGTQPFVIDKYLHSALVDDIVAANMAGTYYDHGHCSPDNPEGSLRGLMTIDSNLQSPQDLRLDKRWGSPVYTSGASPVSASCVLDLTSCEYDAVSGTLTSSKYYADTVFLQQQQPERIIMHVSAGRSQARFLRGATASLQLQSPVRVLIKHSIQSGLLQFIDAAVLDCPRVVADPKSLLMHYLGLALVAEQG
jgi:hypothetical protein